MDEVREEEEREPRRDRSEPGVEEEGFGAKGAGIEAARSAVGED